jgi:hypothetical protein
MDREGVGEIVGGKRDVTPGVGHRSGVKLTTRRAGFEHGLDDRIPEVGRQIVAHPGDDPKAGARDRLRQLSRGPERKDRVSLAVDDRGGDGELAQQGAAIGRGDDGQQVAQEAVPAPAVVSGARGARADPGDVGRRPDAAGLRVHELVPGKEAGAVGRQVGHQNRHRFRGRRRHVRPRRRRRDQRERLDPRGRARRCELRDAPALRQAEQMGGADAESVEKAD